MARRELNFTERKIKKAEKRVKRLKASTAPAREEVTQRINLAENRYQEIVQIREGIHSLLLAAESLNAQVLDLISDWLAKDNGD